MQLLGAHLLHEKASEVDKAIVQIMREGGNVVDILRYIEDQIAAEQAHVHEFKPEQWTDSGSSTPGSDTQQNADTSPQTAATGSISNVLEAGDGFLPQDTAVHAAGDGNGAAPEQAQVACDGDGAPPEEAPVSLAQEHGLSRPETPTDTCTGPEGNCGDFATVSVDSGGHGSVG